MHVPVGSRLGPYEIIAPLGAGGMGEVYRARDPRLGREVALKVISPAGSRDPEQLQRFESEARAASTLAHPNVCAIHDIGSHDGLPFVVMELLEGRSLRAVLRAGAIPLRTAMEYAAQAADGVAAAHARGIVHRDLKPENLFVRTDGRMTVLDFGLAKLSRPEDAANDTMAVTRTTPGVILGTPGYMAPEQLRGEAVDARADVFALGLVLYEMLAGKSPFEGGSTAEVMAAILGHEPAPIAELRSDIPAPLARLVRRCLVKDPDRRVQSIKDIRNELEDMLHEDAPASAARAGGSGAQPVERTFVLTANHVRHLSVRNPRLVGFPLMSLDNQVDSDTLIVCLHGIGGDHRRFEAVLRGLPHRGVALTLAGFAPDDAYRPVLSFDDHLRLLRLRLEDLVDRYRPRRTILVGFSAGADQLLRMLVSAEGLGIEVAGFIGLGPNVSLETCFVSRLFARIDPANPESVLEKLKSLGQAVRPLSDWLVLQTYITETFIKFDADLAPLQQHSAELIAPFERNEDPLPAWYRAATAAFKSVRFVFSDAERAPAEAVLERHLEHDILGERYSEPSFVIERIPHMRLPEPASANRHIASVLAELDAASGSRHRR